MLDLSACPVKPLAHQIIGIEALASIPTFFIGDEVGCGKTLQQVATTCHIAGRETDALLVIAPGSVRSVWVDPDPVMGEWAKHAWPGLHASVTEYCSRTPRLPDARLTAFPVVVSNFEFIRRPERLEPLLAWAKGRKTAIVFDESWAVSNHTAQQYKACAKLVKVCVRATCLNGTPGDPKAVFNQLHLLDPQILGFKNFYAFRGRHAQMGGYLNKQIVGWHDLEKMQERMAPHFLRRLTRDCFDLPPLTTTQIEAPLSTGTWALYTSMRDELVAWLTSGEASIASQAGTKVMRLAQLTSGFLGGVVAPEDDLWTPPVGDPAREVGREKLDALLEWLETGWPDQDKLVVFARFRPEVERTAQALQQRYLSHRVVRIYGGQDAEERDVAKRLLAPGGDPAPAIVVVNTQSGGAGLNFAAASLFVFLSNDYSLKSRLQAIGRLERPGQTRPMRLVDVLATGPRGQKTSDHGIVAKLRAKKDLADATVTDWKEMICG